MSRVEVLPVEGLPEFRPGDDLAGAIAERAGWLRDDDILVVTSKVVSKVEGRLIATGAEPAEREAARQQAITDESVRVLASMGRMRIVETRLGLVLTAAGVDASNVRRDEIALLPIDPDASARRLRAELADRLRVRVGVVISDTASRAWRVGLTDHAIGVAGLRAVEGLRGAADAHGNVLIVTERAVADEVAAAADLVKGKLSGIPVAVVRGLTAVDDPRGSRPLIRPVDEDLFGLGVAEARAEGQRRAVAAARRVREFTDDPVDEAAVRRAITAALALTTSGEQGWWRCAWLTSPAIGRLFDAPTRRRRDELETPAQHRQDDEVGVLRRAPVALVPCVVSNAAGADSAEAPDVERRRVVAAGAGIGGLRIALAAEGLGSCWVDIDAPDVVRARLGLDQSWRPLGALAVGRPANEPPSAPPPSLDEYVRRC
jgi:coenzyme F420-0:L-glutamate ligase/coenzyme F420-1:gamma-L-glutamate ligase